jgi:hypothetical protein
MKIYGLPVRTSTGHLIDGTVVRNLGRRPNEGRKIDRETKKCERKERRREKMCEKEAKDEREKDTKNFLR